METGSQHKVNISGTAANGFFTLIVRIDKDGEENVIHGWRARTFATKKAGMNAAIKWMDKNGVKHSETVHA